jgi:high affinity Mn2+ porin
MKAFITITLIFQFYFASAQLLRDSTARENWNLHLQATIIPQFHFNFGAPYSGQNSLRTSEGVATSFTNTYYIGRRLWKNAALYFNPEIAGGRGLSDAYGIAGFPNGETFRIGSPDLRLYVARLFLEQKFALDQRTGYQEDDFNQLQGRVPVKYISIRAGKFSLADFYDDNAYSHDPRRQFLNWSLMSNGAWDYPANTRGYTVGLVLEYHGSSGDIQFSASQEPTYANGPVLDSHISKAYGLTLEGEKTFHVKGRKGIIHLLLFHNVARMGNYEEAIRVNPAAPDITAVRAYSKSKSGITFSFEQELNSNIGLFLRAGWNDGKNETWAFTEIDQALSGGLVLDGIKWKRPGDTWGFAFSLNGLSGPHRDYLKAGGYGFIIGDGQLNYSGEMIFESYYSFRIPQLHLFLSPDYQYVLHPAYNLDRGPVHIVAARVHLEF